MKKHAICSRLLSVVVAASMLAGMLGLPAFAAEDEAPADADNSTSIALPGQGQPDGQTTDSDTAAPAAGQTDLEGNLPTASGDDTTDLEQDPDIEGAGEAEVGDEDDETESSAPLTLAEIEALVDALPAAETVSADNAEAIQAQLEAIQTALAALEGDEDLDDERYMTLVALADAVQLAQGQTPDEPEVLEETQPVAEVNGSEYATLQEAINAAGSAKTTIKLKTDVVYTTSDIVTVVAGQDIVLDMAGHSITVTEDFVGRPIVNRGTLTMTGNGAIDSSNSKAGGYGAINNFGTLTIENGTYRGWWEASGSCIYNRPGGTLTINGGNFDTATCAIVNEASTTINGGTFVGTTCSSCDSQMWAYTIRNLSVDSRMIFNGGTVTGTQGAISASVGYLEVNGGYFKTVDCKEGHGAIFYALYSAGERGEVECIINGGTFETEGPRTAVLIGNDNKNGDGGINAPSVATINGGTFIAPAGVPAIQRASETGTSQIFGGTFTKISENIQLPEGYTTVTTANGSLQVKAKKVAEVSGATYPTVQAAINAATPGAIVTLLANATECVTVAENQEIVLDLNGFTLTGAKDANGKMGNVVTNNGTLTIQDTSSAQSGTVMGGSDTNQPNNVGRDGIALVNNGTCTLQSGNICRGDNGTFGRYTLQNKGTFLMTGGIVTNNSNVSSLIINYGDMEVSGGTIRQDSMTALKNEYNATRLLITNAADGTQPHIISANSQPLQLWADATISGGKIEGAFLTVYACEYIKVGVVPPHTITHSHLTITGGEIICRQIQAFNWKSDDPKQTTDFAPAANLAIIISGDPIINSTSGLVLVRKTDTVKADSTVGSISVSGGTYATDVTRYCVDGFEVTGTGPYTVQAKTPDPTPTPVAPTPTPAQTGGGNDDNDDDSPAPTATPAPVAAAPAALPPAYPITPVAPPVATTTITTPETPLARPEASGTPTPTPTPAPQGEELTPDDTPLAAPEVQPEKGFNWLWLLIPLVLVGGFVWFLVAKKRKAEQEEQVY